MKCKNKKRGLKVLADKYAHSGDDMKDGVKVMT